MEDRRIGQSHFSRFERDNIPVEILPFLKQRPELTIMKQGEKTKRNYYHCEFCPYETSSQQLFQNHLEDHKSSKAQSCNQCGKVFKNLSKLHAHMQCHEVGKPYICVYCEKKFKRQSSLKVHIKTHFYCESCPVCKKSFSDATALKKHMLVHKPQQIENYQM
ncbi:gastrula zinc finger protein XlCGF32.1-like isoform X2 [Stegodyphus dumicola]|uniref:gastrula zinc finger protein XlCGF32.1-like isoform X2 n=1 Tax=Stegodyphus dumicola TaxID=202533 RepID=UPI0015AF394C|nr:gastrula zinc finger protein XlCGF32.1-like isoform X2 [Stegodyphus dumicola]XP_035207457.1 gastrula zinc finger protein XlCGF32.1-like isoform X2 [Stegodyphus dumicola]